MKKKGFTLVELLAVIVILAIIALIAVPIIMNVVESSRKGAATSSAYGYIDGVKIMYAKEMLSGSDFTLEGTFNVDEEGKLEGHVVEVDGTKAKGGYLTYSNGKITEGCLTIGDYKVTLENDTAKETIKGACEGKGTEEIVKESPVEWFTFVDNDDGTATITGFSEAYDTAYQSNEEGVKDIVIPSKSNTGKKVTTISSEFQKYDESCDWEFCTYYQKFNLNSVYIPDSIETIEDYAFSELSLNSVRLGLGVKKIGSWAFSYNDTRGGNMETYGNNIIKLTIPDSVIEIGAYAFSTNDLESLDLGNGVQTIGEGAFGDNNLTSVAIPNSVKYLTGFNDNNLTEIDIPSSVTAIGDYAFSSSNLTSVTIPNSVTTIGNNAFQYNNLTSLDLGNGVQTIGHAAFYSNNLTSVTIPNSVIEIGQSAFYGNNLTSVDLGNGVETIGGYAFNKNSTSNPTLTKIINKTGKAFDWGYIVNSSYNMGRYTFETGTIENDYGNVIVTNGEE